MGTNRIGRDAQHVRIQGSDPLLIGCHRALVPADSVRLGGGIGQRAPVHLAVVGERDGANRAYVPRDLWRAFRSPVTKSEHANQSGAFYSSSGHKTECSSHPVMIALRGLREVAEHCSSRCGKNKAAV
jgi:hypothetical protein